jgi:hypothetical protein
MRQHTRDRGTIEGLYGTLERLSELVGTGWYIEKKLNALPKIELIAMLERQVANLQRASVENLNQSKLVEKLEKRVSVMTTEMEGLHIKVREL